MVDHGSFFQAPPSLANQYDDDRVLFGYLTRALPRDLHAAQTDELRELGEDAGGRLYRMQLEDRQNEPKLTSYDPWGHRIDHIELTPLWKEAARIAAERGLVATGYEGTGGPWARVLQFAKVYLFHASTDVYTCPLAMTDGAARTLLTHGNQMLIDRAVPRLISRDPARMWTSGQWMTERTGGSDVGRSETRAVRDQEGHWRLFGTKWFTSAITSPMALTLARPEGNPEGGRGLALFYVQVTDEQGERNRIWVNRLKDKLGTRKVPTAELTLDGAEAIPVAGLTEGIRSITPMLNITRIWNAVCSISTMRRALALARDYASKRVAFGALLRQKPLHLETLAGLQAEFEAAFALTFFAVELLGRVETQVASETELLCLRLITPVVKATTGKQAVSVVSEVLECFGGAGYVEDTGLPLLLRDAQVLPIWEGTTNVLSLDMLRALGKGGEGLRAFREEALRRTEVARGTEVEELAHLGLRGLDRARVWWLEVSGQNPLVLEAGARGFLMTVGRSMALCLLAEQAAWALSRGDRRPLLAARRFASHGVDRLGVSPLEEAAVLALDMV
ncbi:MAG: acyl-CoA dehydrogenase family protein [Myxococcales bacterium]|nr:acyl-CoA dehydrogenase family protein [Polyangiaceae bacterium]MDW8250800.1 acyl-CoA dehydrogenase family protein [Myxococcales bacterium]